MDITIHNALIDKSFEIVNIGIDNGRFIEITKGPISAGEKAIDAHGQLITPPFFEPHFHLDNPFLWDEINQSGTLAEAIDLYSRKKKNRDLAELEKKASTTVRESLAHGVLWLRSHVDIDQIIGLKGLKSVKAVKDKFAGVVDISIIAFPQMGLVNQPEVVDLMYEAMENGADLVGGTPHFERNMEDAGKQIDIVFKIAKKYDADIDMHVDEIDDPNWQSLELLADKTIAENYQGRVNASHCVSMGSWDDTTFERIADKVKKANITITTNVLTNLFLQGRGSHQSIRREIPRIADLMKAGINVTCGHDDIKNMFYPFGNMNPLYSANVAAHAGQLTTSFLIREAFEMPSYHCANLYHFTDYGIKVGNPANLLVLPVSSEIDAIRLMPAPTLVMRSGKCLVTSEFKSSFASEIPA